MKEKIENMVRKIISCRLLYYILIMLLFIATYYINLKIKLAEDNITDTNHLKYCLIFSSISGIIILLLIIFSKKLYEKLKPHFVYMILALIVGGMYIFFIPLCAQSDEPAHIYRVFQIASGEFISHVEDGETKTEMPISIINMINVNSKEKKPEYKKYYDIKEMKDIELNEGETSKIRMLAGGYNAISYIPQTIGVKIGMILKLNPYFTAMLGRITGLIIIVLLFT